MSTDWWDVPPEQRFAEGAQAYRESRFAPLSRDFLSRFGRDPRAEAEAGETVVDDGWVVRTAPGAGSPTQLMAGHLARFLREAMAVDIEAVEAVEDVEDGAAGVAAKRAISLVPGGGGDPTVPESFTLTVTPAGAVVHGADEAGVRDGVVKLIDLMGFRAAPFLRRGTVVHRPRLAVRLGGIPYGGDMHDAVLHGYNAVLVPGGHMSKLSVSQAIPEVTPNQEPAFLERLAQGVADARRYGLRTYAQLWNDRWPEDHPVWAAHPGCQGIRTHTADGGFVLCSEVPLVQQYIDETIQGIFTAAPDLDGVVMIIGGESFYHCYMHPFGNERGDTHCPRCQPLGAYQAVANLVNRVAAAARAVNPSAEAVAWPYSGYRWSEHPHEVPFIERLKPGAALHTEIEKDEHITTPHGADVWLWDYSVHLVGPGPRAREQVDTGRKVGIPVYLKNEPELSFEAARLPHMPALDLWLDRADATVSCGGSGAWEFPALRPSYGTSAAEVSKHVWWEPAPARDEVLGAMAVRIAGADGAPHLRQAWTSASSAIGFAPEIPPYFAGPLYLGPAHPMCVDRDAEVPEIFYGKLLFQAFLHDAKHQLRPTFHLDPLGPYASFGRAYRTMADLAAAAAAAVDEADRLVPDRCRLMFDSEASSIRLLDRTLRTTANFHESCFIRNTLASGPGQADAEGLLRRWVEVLRDELDNARTAAPLIDADMRIETHVAFRDHLYHPLAQVLQAKISLLEQELADVTARLAAQEEPQS